MTDETTQESLDKLSAMLDRFNGTLPDEALTKMLDNVTATGNDELIDGTVSLIVEKTQFKVRAVNARVKDMLAVIKTRKFENEKAKSLVDREASNAESVFHSTLPGDSYLRSDGYIYAEIEKDEHLIRIKLCSDMEVSAHTRDTDMNRWAYRVRFIDLEKNIREVDLPYEWLAADEKRAFAALADAGFWITADGLGRRSVVSLLVDYNPEEIIRTCYSAGWYGDQFVTPLGEVIGPDDGNSLTLHKSGMVKDDEYCGSFKGWQKAVKKAVNVEKTPHWGLGVCAGVAAVLISKLDETSFGLNIYGSSSRGKSIMQKIAASMWANPATDQGLRYTCRTTDNGIEFFLERGSGVGCHLDEIRNAPIKAFVNIPFMIAGETGRKRMKANGEERKSKSWKTCVTLSSEQALASLIAQAGEVDVSGMHVRMPGISVTELESIDVTKATAIEDGIDDNFGWAGPEFVRYVLEVGDEQIGKLIADHTHHYAEQADDATVKRAARSFGILGACAELLQEGGIVSKDVDLLSCIDWAWDTWRASGVAAKLSPVQYSATLLRAWLQTNPHKVKHTSHAEEANQEVVAYHDEKYVYLLAGAIEKIGGIQTEEKALIKALDAKGEVAREGKHLKHTHIPRVGGGRAHFRLKWRLYGGDEKDASFGTPDYLKVVD